jgi:hypothetical protein
MLTNLEMDKTCKLDKRLYVLFNLMVFEGAVIIIF